MDFVTLTTVFKLINGGKALKAIPSIYSNIKKRILQEDLSTKEPFIKAFKQATSFIVRQYPSAEVTKHLKVINKYSNQQIISIFKLSDDLEIDSSFKLHIKNKFNEHLNSFFICSLNDEDLNEWFDRFTQDYKKQSFDSILRDDDKYRECHVKEMIQVREERDEFIPIIKTIANSFEPLSDDLLKNICKENLDLYKCQQDGAPSKLDNLVLREEIEDIERTIFQSENILTILNGASGRGKSILSYQLLLRYIQDNKYGLWVKPEIIQESSSITEAIEKCLKVINPNLASNSANQALNLADKHPMLLIIDDINTTANPKKLLETIRNYSKIIDDKNIPNYKIICPTWPHIAGIDLRSQSQKHENIVNIDFMTDEKAKNTIKNIMNSKNIKYSDYQIEMLVKNLKNDPYLLGLLEEFVDANSVEKILNISQNILDNFTNKIFNDIAANNIDFLEVEYESNLLKLCYQMLKIRKYKLSIDEVKNISGIDFNCLRIVLNNKKLCSCDQESNIIFRHDRIRDYLCVKAVIKELQQENIDEEVLTNPYYSEIIGQVLANYKLNKEILDKIKTKIPIALLKAVNYINEEEIDNHYLIDIILEIFEKYYVNIYPNSSLFNDLGNTLLEIESEKFIKKCRVQFGEHIEGWAHLHWLLVNLKYGDLLSGAVYFNKFSKLYSFNSQINHIIYHTKHKYYERIEQEIINLLSDQNNFYIKGTLILIGHLKLKNKSICSAILKCWDRPENKKEYLLEFAWALLNSYDDTNTTVLTPILSFFNQLSDKEDQYGSSELGNYMDVLRKVYSYSYNETCLSDNAILGIIEFVSNNNNLELYIAYIFRHIDNKVALEYCIRYYAKLNEERQEKFNIHGMIDNWDPRLKRNLLSENTLNYLINLWKNSDENEYVKKIAFQFWQTGAKLSNIEDMKTINKDSLIFSQAIYKRIELGDKSALSQYKEILNDRHSFYIEHRCWCQEMFDIANTYLKKVSDEADFNLPGLIIRIPKSDAEKLLQENWQILGQKDKFIMAALHVGTSDILKLAGKVLSELPEDKTIKFHLTPYAGENKTEGIYTEEFLKNLAPYYNKVDKDCLDELADHYSYIKKSISQGVWDLLISNLTPDDQKNYLPATESDIAGVLNEYIDKEENNNLWMLEDCLKRLSKEERIVWKNALPKWFQSNKTLKGFEVVTECIKHVGTRKDLDLLHEFKNTLISELHPCPTPVLDNRIEDAEFYIYRNQLN